MMMRTIKLAVSFGVLAALIWWADAARIAARLRDADLAWLALALLSLTALTLLMARRWQIVAARLALVLPYRAALGEYYIAQMVNLVLPGGVLGDVGRAVRVRNQGTMVCAAQSVAAERIIGQATLLALMGVAFTIALILPGGIAWPLFAWGGILLLLVALGVVLVFATGTSAIARFLAFVLSCFRDLRLVAYALGIAGLLILSLYACAHATGTVIPPDGWFTLIPLILSAMLIPLSVGGWGWREGAATALFPLIGAAPDAGVAMGIAYGAMMMIAALPALYFLMRTPASQTQPNNSGLDLT
jgi:uncharacterized membrane protein YbhN (UPF0104 family)